MKKTALIIGNSKYPGNTLKNPINDANAIADKLGKLGFTVKIFLDLSNQEMDSSVSEFRNLLDSNEVGLFYFAGHGMQIEGENYLMATDTKFDYETDAKHSSLKLNKVIDILKNGNNSISIVILDACRNNPYEAKWRSIGSRGLAPVYAPKGTIIAYATSPGEIALDGTGENSPYAYALLEHLETQDIPIEAFFKRVRNTLSAITKGKQTSWEHTSLMGEFSFNYSVLNNEFVPVYSGEALGDSAYIYSSENQLHAIIRELQSHDWYVQNPGIAKLDKLDLNVYDKNDLFVLGRNIYQAACGSSNSALKYLDHFESHSIGDEILFHILNGILFEIYFDSKGIYRKQKKTESFLSVANLLLNARFEKSAIFIQQMLKPYSQQLFYMPGDKKSISVDVEIKNAEQGRVISDIFFNGERVLYNYGGTEYLDINNENFILYEATKLNELIAQTLLVPTSKVQINYSDHFDVGEKVGFPYFFKIQKYFI